MNTVYLVQSTPDYQGQFTHFASLEFEKAEASTIQIMREQDVYYLEIIAVPLEQINASKFEMPVWQSVGAYRNREPRVNLNKFDTIEIAPGIWKSVPQGK